MVRHDFACQAHAIGGHATVLVLLQIIAQNGRRVGGLGRNDSDMTATGRAQIAHRSRNRWKGMQGIAKFFQRQRLYVIRSEEHTSELQSLMRKSYAVFGLNTNNKKVALLTAASYDNTSLDKSL